MTMNKEEIYKQLVAIESDTPELGPIFITKDGKFINIGAESIHNTIFNDEEYDSNDYYDLEDTYGLIKANGGNKNEPYPYIDMWVRPNIDQIDAIRTWVDLLIISNRKTLMINTPSTEINVELNNTSSKEVIKTILRFFTTLESNSLTEELNKYYRIELEGVDGEKEGLITGSFNYIPTKETIEEYPDDFDYLSNEKRDLLYRYDELLDKLCKIKSPAVSSTSIFAFTKNKYNEFKDIIKEMKDIVPQLGITDAQKIVVTEVEVDDLDVTYKDDDQIAFKAHKSKRIIDEDVVDDIIKKYFTTENIVNAADDFGALVEDVSGDVLLVSPKGIIISCDSVGYDTHGTFIEDIFYSIIKRNNVTDPELDNYPGEFELMDYLYDNLHFLTLNSGRALDDRCKIVCGALAKAQQEVLTEWLDYTAQHTNGVIVFCNNNQATFNFKQLVKRGESPTDYIIKSIKDCIRTGLLEKVVKKGSNWQVQSEKGRNMGTYKTKKEAENRLHQIEYFKHINESDNSESDDSEPKTIERLWITGMMVSYEDGDTEFLSDTFDYVHSKYGSEIFDSGIRNFWTQIDELIIKLNSDTKFKNILIKELFEYGDTDKIIAIDFEVSSVLYSIDENGEEEYEGDEVEDWITVFEEEEISTLFDSLVDDTLELTEDTDSTSEDEDDLLLVDINPEDNMQKVLDAPDWTIWRPINQDGLLYLAQGTKWLNSYSWSNGYSDEIDPESWTIRNWDIAFVIINKNNPKKRFLFQKGWAGLYSPSFARYSAGTWAKNQSSKVKKWFIDGNFPYVSNRLRKEIKSQEILDKSVYTYPSDGKISWSVRSKIQNVVIEEGTKRINQYALSGFNLIKHIKLPNSVKVISDWSMDYNHNLEKVELNNGLNTIGKYAFYGCISLKEIDIPRSVTEIKTGAFSDCTALTKIFIPSTVQIMGSTVFYPSYYSISRLKMTIYCEANEKPNGWDEHWYNKNDDITVIWGAKGMNEPTTEPIKEALSAEERNKRIDKMLNTSRETIMFSIMPWDDNVGDDYDYYNSRVDEIVHNTLLQIPDVYLTEDQDYKGIITWMMNDGANILSANRELQDIFINYVNENPDYFDEDLNYLICLVAESTEEGWLDDAVIFQPGNLTPEPDTTLFLEESAPENNTATPSDTLKLEESTESDSEPTKIKRVEVFNIIVTFKEKCEYAFSAMDYVKHNYGQYLSTDGDTLDLTELTKKLKGDSKFKTILIEELRGLGDLDKIITIDFELVKSVYSVNKKGEEELNYADQEGYQELYDKDDISELLYSLADDTLELTEDTDNTYEDDDLELISDEYAGLFNIKDGVLIGLNIDWEDRNLITSITIPDSVTCIGEYAFYHCESLTSITIPNGVKTIGKSAFELCKSLESVVISNSVTEIGGDAFAFCFLLKSIVIPNSVTKIDDYAFFNCFSLTIYCEAFSKPEGWDKKWNPDDRPVIWGYKSINE